ncbi:MAG: UDP-3-O-(3-hydroxymyristoyl)glucosamine N-acyltransferase [Acidaminococcaceae bacterium]|nr:UDP-3-O-(3-hydroxymyristoyl)glucosamine N-acyltransferase [Acidaminococcaceae bacterium]
MNKTVGELAQLLQGKVEGDASKLIAGVNGLEEASSEQISFAVPPYVEHCHLSRAGAMVLALDDPSLPDRPVIKVANPRAAFAQLLEIFRAPEEVERVISHYAYVSPQAHIGKNVAIQAFAYVADDAVVGDDTVIYPHVYVGKKVTLGAGCVLYPSVTVREGCQIGARCILQAGCVIGGDGFGFITTNGKHSKVLQTGNVVLGDDVEVGCNTCIDRATVDSTIVGNGTKIDNLVHLGHNDIVGENCLFVAHVGISGSVNIGHNCTFGGQAATVGHITIGDNCTFAGRAGIIGDIPSNSILAGFPAQPHKEWLREEASLRKVGSLLKQVKALEKAVAALQADKK